MTKKLLMSKKSVVKEQNLTDRIAKGPKGNNNKTQYSILEINCLNKIFFNQVIWFC